MQNKAVKTTTLHYDTLQQKVGFVDALLKRNGGKFYSLKFLKADNTVRNMIGQKLKPLDRPSLNKRNPNSTQQTIGECFKGTRSFNKENVLQMKMGGVVYKFKYEAK